MCHPVLCSCLSLSLFLALLSVIGPPSRRPYDANRFHSPLTSNLLFPLILHEVSMHDMKYVCFPGIATKMVLGCVTPHLGCLWPQGEFHTTTRAEQNPIVLNCLFRCSLLVGLQISSTTYKLCQRLPPLPPPIKFRGVWKILHQL